MGHTWPETLKVLNVGKIHPSPLVSLTVNDLSAVSMNETALVLEESEWIALLSHWWFMFMFMCKLTSPYERLFLPSISQLFVHLYHQQHEGE